MQGKWLVICAILGLALPRPSRPCRGLPSGRRRSLLLFACALLGAWSCIDPGSGTATCETADSSSNVER
jgi:hypothetical protein